MSDRSVRELPCRLPIVRVLLAVLLLAWGHTAFAQSERTTSGDGVSEVAARAADDGPLHWAVPRAGAPLAQSLAPEAQRAKPPNSAWLGRHPVITGTLIGTGAGFAFSRFESVGGKNHDPRVALIGTGAGAWGGLIASAVHKVRSKEKVGLGTKAGIAAGAVGLIVLPVLACYGAGGCGGSS